jgi:hypothetical protein
LATLLSQTGFVFNQKNSFVQINDQGMLMKQLLYVNCFLLFSWCAIAQHVQALFLFQAKFTTGNNANWASTTFSDTDWKTIKTREVWQSQGFPDYHGYAWHRIRVVILFSFLNKFD